MDRKYTGLMILLHLATPVGYLICMISAAFSVNFVLLNVDVPAFQLRNFYSVVMYAVRIGCGLSLTVAQVFGFVFYKFTADRRAGITYWFATAASVYMSLCTFYSLIQIEKVDAMAEASSKKMQSAEYKLLVNQLDRARAKIAEIEKDRAKTMAIYDRFDQASKKITANIEYDKRTSRYENDVRALTKEIAEFTSGIQAVQAKVTVDQTHKLIAQDIVRFFGNTSAEVRINMMLQYSLILALAIIIDFSGVNLILIGVKKSAYAIQIRAKIEADMPHTETSIFINSETVVTPTVTNSELKSHEIGGVVLSKNQPKNTSKIDDKIAKTTPPISPENTPKNSGVVSDIGWCSFDGNNDETQKADDNNSEQRPRPTKIENGVITDSSSGVVLKGVETTSPAFDITSLKIGGVVSEADYCKTWGNLCGDSLYIFGKNYTTPNGSKNGGVVFGNNQQIVDPEKVNNIMKKYDRETVAKIIAAVGMYDSLNAIRNFVYPDKSGAFYNKKIKDIASKLGLEIPNVKKA